MDKKALLEQLLNKATASKKRQANAALKYDKAKKVHVDESSSSNSNPNANLSAEAKWKKRRNEILNSLNSIRGKKEVVNETDQENKTNKTTKVDKDEIRMNVQLMNGEIPKVYQDLLLRFKIADIFLKQNISKMTRLTDINNYTSLSDTKLSFTENHVQNIVYLYAYNEANTKTKVAYIMGRTRPKIVTDMSILTLKLPFETDENVKDQIDLFLGSSRNLSGIFSTLKEEGRKDFLKSRYDTLNKHISEYIDKVYNKYLQQNGLKPLDKGRVPSFTMQELGEMPLGEIPPPIIVYRESLDTAMERLQKDVEQAV